MKLKNKFSIAALLLAGLFSVQAQTIGLTTTTPTSSATIGGGDSIILGSGAGVSLTTTGTGNTCVGFQSGKLISTGDANITVGTYAGQAITSSGFNILIGHQAGANNNSTNGSNVMIGHAAGAGNATGFGNVFLGHMSGLYATGSGNIFLGSNVTAGGVSGTPFTGSDKLYVDNSNTTSPLIWGDFANDQVKLNGKVGIGAVASFPSNALYTNYKLFVTGGILADELRIAASSSGAWPDYVFAENYTLKPLSEVEKFISEKGHLPNVPSAAEVEKDGIAVGKMTKIQQEKIEELTLYIIAQEKRIQALEAKLSK